MRNLEEAKVYFPNAGKILKVRKTNANTTIFCQMKKDNGVYIPGWNTAERVLREDVTKI